MKCLNICIVCSWLGVVAEGIAAIPKAEVAFSSVERGNEIEIKSLLAEKNDFYAVIRRNTYALQDYSYRLLVSAPEKKIISLDVSGANQQFVRVGRIGLANDGELIIPLSNKNKAYFYKYDKKNGKVSTYIDMALDFDIDSIFFSGGRFFVAGIKSGRSKLFELISDDLKIYKLREVELSGYIALNFNDLIVEKNIYIAAEFVVNNKKEFGTLSVANTGQSKYVKLPPSGPNAEIKIIGFLSGAIAVSINDLTPGSYKKISGIFFTDFSSTPTYKKFSGSYVQSSTALTCTPFEVVALNIQNDEKNDKLSYQYLNNKTNIDIEFPGEYRKLYSQIFASRTDSGIYAGLVYNEIRNYKSFQIFSVVKVELADNAECKK